MKVKQCVLLFCFVAAACGTSATEQRAIQVAQPIVTDSGICVCDVTFVRYLGAELWGETVGYTCDESFVVVESGKPVNMNGANLAGLNAAAFSYHAQEQALFGDTMKVWIDLSKMDLSKVPYCNTHLIEATVECVLINATRSITAWDQRSQRDVAAKHVTVVFHGAPDSSYSTRTYLVEELLKTVPREQMYECE